MMIRRKRESEAGMTLVELLLALSLSVVLLSVLGAALIAGVRGAKTTADSYQNSADALAIATYLPQDIQSVASRGDITMESEVSNVPLDCATTGLTLPAAETHLFKLEWAGDTATRAITYAAYYRLAPEPATTPAGAGRARLTRYFCASDGEADVTVLARNLSAAAADKPKLTESDTGFSVEFVDVLSNGSRLPFTIKGEYRLGVAGGTTGTPVFSTCTLSPARVSPNPGIRTTTGDLTNNPIFTVTPSGNCADLKITYSKGDASTSSVTQSLTDVGGSWSRPLDVGGWTQGSHDIELRAASGERVTVPFSVDTLAPPCSVSSVVTDDSAGTRKSNPSPNTIVEGAVTVTATAAGCTSLVLIYTPTAGTTRTFTMSTSNGTTWTYVISSTEMWSDGSTSLRVHDGTVAAPGTQLGTTNFVVSAKTCSILNISATPSTVRQANGSGTVKKLRAEVTVTVTSDGVCTGLRLRYTPNDTVQAQTATLVETAAGSGTWRYVLDDNGGTAQNWTVDDHRLDALLSSPDDVQKSTILKVTS